MQKEEYLIKNACYSVTKYYLCKQNNKRSLLGRKQRSQVARSFPNRYQFSCTNKVTSLFSISCILRIILPCKTYAFGTQNNRFYNALKVSELHNRCACEKYLQHYRFLFVPKTGCIIYFPLSDFKHLLDTKEFLIVKQSHSTRNTEDYTYNVNTLSDLFYIYVKKKRNIFQYVREIQ